MDDLYEELSSSEDAVETAVQSKDLTTLQKLHKLFETQNLPILQKIFAFIASIPVSNAATERIFS